MVFDLSTGGIFKATLIPDLKHNLQMQNCIGNNNVLSVE